MLLLLLIIILLYLTEFSLLSFEGTKDKSGLFATEVVENCLGNYLANLNQVKASFTKLAD